jgi:hypothetical protein
MKTKSPLEAQYDLDLPAYTVRPKRRRQSHLTWSQMMDSFEPFIREHLRKRAANPEAYREKYRITETKRFSLD